MYGREHGILGAVDTFAAQGLHALADPDYEDAPRAGWDDPVPWLSYGCHARGGTAEDLVELLDSRVVVVAQDAHGAAGGQGWRSLGKCRSNPMQAVEGAVRAEGGQSSWVTVEPR
ncbi:hypothetical protein [Acrocarpospora pleiomorpha]